MNIDQCLGIGEEIGIDHEVEVTPEAELVHEHHEESIEMEIVHQLEID